MDFLKKIGINRNEKYETFDSINQLSYNKILMLSNFDPDGAYQKGLLINMIHSLNPNLLKHGFIEEVCIFYVIHF